jgi:hypothetical protein
MARMNWSRSSARDRVRMRGSDDICGREPSVVLPFLKTRRGKPRPTKAELRERGAKALEAFKGEIRKVGTAFNLHCPQCHHSGRAVVPPGHRMKFRCSKCGTRI